MFVKRTVDEASIVFLTGFNVCSSGYELNHNFSSLDVQCGGCLDASSFVPRGSVTRVDCSFGEVRAVASVCPDLLNTRMGF